MSTILPPSLDLPAHLSAHKYFFVCTLTVAAWDTLVLSPRTWRLMKTGEWPPLKIIFQILRYLMPIEFTIVAVAFFSQWTPDMCQKFYLFEPVTTAILMGLCSLTLCIRLSAIYDKNRMVKFGLSALLAIQVVADAVCCGFYQGQGCIAGPRQSFVALYWAVPTAFYTVCLVLAIHRSLRSRRSKAIGLWKLILRDGLNLYGAIWIVNMINFLFWIIAQPTDSADTIKTIVTSMCAVLTTTMSLRVILSVRGSLAEGGSYAGQSQGSTSGNRSGPSGVSFSRNKETNVVNISNAGTGRNNQTFTLEEMRSRAERDWQDDGKASITDSRSVLETKTAEDTLNPYNPTYPGVTVTIDREVEHPGAARAA
ncbi:hypothetical protein DACRYDRAFT_15200 [Dacryopinax primogenitus]|uniref:Transmembrane protein n=1 Tax=Dacryopinax primogenitus (strain DJM 731) TaxID=1858805 RepID=M5G572_DACPD|nr:uncharacterized protein DACRYDRAFT_15200 [Dacryopinax primogenitus]EJU03380.1 hypothetical protein DACRYDRAFT_15200 [Dacryopinax primogenitus]